MTEHIFPAQIFLEEGHFCLGYLLELGGPAYAKLGRS